MGMKNRFVNINKKIICFVIFLSILGVSSVQSMYEKEEAIFTNNIADNSEIVAFSPPIAFIFGEINNINEGEFFKTFNAVNVRCITFIPFNFELFRSDEQITVLDKYFRLLQPNLVFGIFGYIGASIESTPEIHFDAGLENLVVTYTNLSNVLWSDIAISGLCDRSELGTYVSVGDQITNCTGTIEILYIPTVIILGYWTFW